MLLHLKMREHSWGHSTVSSTLGGFTLVSMHGFERGHSGLEIASKS